MSGEWLILIGAVFIVVLLILFRNTAFVKKNWKYFLIIAPLMIFLVLKIMSGSKSKGDGQKPSSEGKSEDLGESVEKLKDKLQEVQIEVAIEVSAAKTKNEEVIKELEEVKKIEDKSERRKRLAAMIG